MRSYSSSASAAQFDARVACQEKRLGESEPRLGGQLEELVPREREGPPRERLGADEVPARALDSRPERQPLRHAEHVVFGRDLLADRAHSLGLLEHPLPEDGVTKGERHL